ncbi:MAG: hypothetical protein V4692_11740, partial [Bdellovibrionota bacterium]
FELPKIDREDQLDSFLPSMTGLVDADRIMQSYEVELKRAQSQAQHTQLLAQWQASVQNQLQGPKSELQASLDLLSRYEITQVAISIGIEPKYGESYREKLEQWVTNRVKFEFNRSGTAEVRFIEAP